MDAPKLFISYAWTNEEHEYYVLNLATSLRESGVDVILDKWDLKEGNDSIAFMEKMVTDKDIKKVAMICNKHYKEKADGRSGGVGTETQIISKEVYEKQDQEKFVAVVSEKDGDGNPFLPIYYTSRIYIDLSEAEKYSENFERLLRWIFDKPLYIKPPIGTKPSFIDNDSISLGTSTKYRRLLDAIQNSKNYYKGALADYLDEYINNLENFRIDKGDGEPDDKIFDSINNFLINRNEFITIIHSIARYGHDTEVIELFHKFFEKSIYYYSRPTGVTQWIESDYDNFRFIIHELFLYTLTVLIKNERYSSASMLLEQKYYSESNNEYGRDPMVSYAFFRSNLSSFEQRNRRLNLRRLSLRADLLKERNASSNFRFFDLMQSDFICYIRLEFDKLEKYDRWWPETLLYIGEFSGPFEVFARAKSKKYFDKIKCLIGVDSKEEISGIMNEFGERRRRVPQWDFHSVDPFLLMGYENICKIG